MKNSLIRTLVILTLITVVSFGAILYAKGYRFSKDIDGRNVVSGTGLLVFNSVPDGARAFINGELATATDDTINLKPGKYGVRIEKDGYFPWEKEVEITKERVTETNALLFPKAPQLENLTSSGVNNPTVDKERKILAYTVSSASADLNGVYVASLNRGFLSLGDGHKQIASNLIDNFSGAKLEVSPDGAEVFATIESQSTGIDRVYLLKTNEFNPSPLLVTNNVERIRETWKTDEERLRNDKIRSLPKAARAMITTYFKDPLFSPEKDKIFYIASSSAELPLVIKPRIPSTNSTPEVRNISEGDVYVYNIKDDRNYLVRAKSENAFPEYIWHPDSRHLFYVEGKRINTVEYDGHNITTVYAGPFLNDFVTPWLDGSGIVILTSFNDPSIPPNLYRVVLK